MDYKEMRSFLKEKGITPPRANADVEKMYKTENPEIVKLVASNIYTYVGAGDTPPEIINFMGQRFIRGEAVEVPLEVREKIENHICFVKGKAERSTLSESDTKERDKAEKKIRESHGNEG